MRGWRRSGGGGLRVAALVAGLLAGAAVRAQAQEGPPAPANPFAGQPEVVPQGRALYLKWGCYGCHGTQGGGGMGPSLVDAEWRYGKDDASVFESVKAGRPNGMPGWAEKLTDEEIWKMIAYLRSLTKPEAGGGAR